MAAPGCSRESYRVTVRSAVAAGGPDVLPLPSGTSTLHPGYLVYRVRRHCLGLCLRHPPRPADLLVGTPRHRPSTGQRRVPMAGGG